MSFFKLLTYIWPFVKELMLGDKTLVEAFKTNKKKVFMTVIIMLSFAINIFIIPKLLTISGQHVILQREHEKLRAQHLEMKDTSPIKGGKTVAAVEDPPLQEAVEEETQVPVSISKPARKGKVSQPDDRVVKMREHFDAIRRQEERE